MHRNTSTDRATIVLAALLLVTGPGRPCRADLLQFQFGPDGPTIQADNGNLTYNATTGEFSGSVTPTTLSSPLLPGSGVATFEAGSQLTFDFFVNPDGTFRSDPDGFNLNGVLTLNLPSGGQDRISGSLLSGDFYAFGAEPEGPPAWVANALVDPTGGLLSRYETLVDGSTLPPLFPIGGHPLGITFTVEDVTGGTLGDFSRSFSSDDVGIQGGTAVPEPPSWMLPTVAALACGVFGLTRRRIAPAS